MNPPRHRVPANWGYCFEGNANAFCSALDLAVDSVKDRPFRYCEIGLGHGDGMRAAQRYLHQSGIDHRFIGVDIATCDQAAWMPKDYPFPDLTEIHLCGSTKFFEYPQSDLGFVFIDGCHGSPCAGSDFHGAENLMAAGGVVVFHDSDPGCQGLHLQPHCGMGIDVRHALWWLGLLDGSRPGWNLITETTGDKSKGGHGMSIFQRS